MSFDLSFMRSLEPGDTALVVMSLIIAALFLVVLLFSGYAILLRFRHDRRDKLWAELRQMWDAPLLDVLTDRSNIPALRALVPAHRELHFVQYILDYTRRVRGEERRILRETVEPFLGEIARRASHSNPQVRTRAIQTLGLLGLPKYEREVLAGLQDESPIVSFVAARYLARAEFPQYGMAVLDTVPRYDGANFRFLASMLAAIGSSISEQLRERMSDPERPEWERAVMAEALTMQRDPRAGDVAAEVVREAEDPDLAIRLLRLLGTVGHRDHLTAIRFKSTAPDAFVRAQALSALGRVGDERELPVLLAGMDDASPWVALHAARAVRDVGGKDMLFDLAQSSSRYGRLAGQVLYEEAEA